MPTPLLIISDSPNSYTGLGRITRELATRIHENMQDVFRVATFGFGETGSRHLPFEKYSMAHSSNYVPYDLPKVWKDFAGDQEGIVLTIWNASWLGWFAEPEKLPDGELKTFMETPRFKKWGYFPIDGTTGVGLQPKIIADRTKRFDRVLAYTKWAENVIMDSSPDYGEVHALPHGLDTSVFYPRDRKGARKQFVERILGNPGLPPLDDYIFLIGVVATNTPRKDWYLAFQVCSELLSRGVQVGLWAHTDAYQKNWDLLALATEFGMDGRWMPSNKFLSDEDMALAYSACDVTLAIGSGEGWGYPIAESLACGVPVIHGDYAGGAEIVPADGLVQPYAWRGDGFYGIRRPVYRASDWADKVQWIDKNSSRASLLPPYIDWKNAWPAWEKWLREGVE